ncbi:MAG: hypothetical protein HRT58_02095 [Crocinitomicaceae bacterium]|nr:hypothetical protein [Flavobacteriales bacterium]NQZ34418.1 hypothetical protein [Crocinitomicaceae bacterium]
MPSIKQALKTSDNTYEVNDAVVDIVNAPNDCDWSRWGMLDDRRSTRMYCFKQGTIDQLYQFIFDGTSYQFEENFTLTISGVGDDQNLKKIAMLSTPNFEEAVGVKDKELVGSKYKTIEDAPFLPIPQNYHVYIQAADDQQFLYQFIWKEDTRNFKPNGITRDWFKLKDFPSDTDWDRWTMTYDSNHYQLSLPAYVYYAFKKDSNDEIYFGRYGARGDQEYEDDGTIKIYDVYSYNPEDQPIDKPGDQYYGQAKCGNIKIIGLAEDFEVTDLSIVFDGIDTFMYLLTDKSE